MKNRILKYLFEITIHVFFWIGVYFFYNYFLGFGRQNTVYVKRFSLFLMPITIVVSYLFLYYLIPNFLFKKRQKLFTLYSIYTLIVSFFFVVFSIFFGLVFSDGLKKENYVPLTKGFFFIILGVYFVVFVVTTIGLLTNNYKENIKIEDFKNRFLQAELQLKEQELKFLKMQIHPHFLFNTLNTLYGFALKKADIMPEMILKLSNLLDYILYQVEKPQVLLFDEIKHIEDYISLEEMRFQESLDVRFKKEINQENHQIAPMLLLPFVENSFKHGTQINGVLKVDMKLKTTNAILFFQIENSAKETHKNKNGIGLENIQKRLEMLYQNNFGLHISTEENKFKVQLEIPLKNA